MFYFFKKVTKEQKEKVTNTNGLSVTPCPQPPHIVECAKKCDLPWRTEQS